MTFNDLGYTTTGTGAETSYTNLNGSFTLSSGTGCVLITGSSVNGEGNTVYVKVGGTTPESIETAVNPTEALACAAS